MSRNLMTEAVIASRVSVEFLQTWLAGLSEEDRQMLFTNFGNIVEEVTQIAKRNEDVRRRALKAGFSSEQLGEGA